MALKYHSDICEKPILYSQGFYPVLYFICKNNFVALPNRFNIRVYGIFVNAAREVLVMDEKRFGIKMTKFPGGGLDFGEGISDGLKREWMEELNLEIEVLELFYINDFFQASAFRETDQLLSVYYFVKPLGSWESIVSNKPFDFPDDDSECHSVRFIPLNQLDKSDFTFPVDQKVAELLSARI